MEFIEKNVTPQWLTRALDEAGLLKEGKVVSFKYKPLLIADFQSPRTALLELNIQGARQPVPQRMVLKLARGEKEYHFFTKIAPQTKMKQIVNCYYAELLDAGESAVFLLEDLSQSHQQSPWPLPPSVAQCISAVECLAQFHAFWWDHADLQNDLLERSRQTTHWLQRIQMALASLPAFMDSMGDRLSVERRTIFEKIAISENKNWLPEQCKHGSTLLHGDAHFWNFLYDREGDLQKIKIFDWNSWNVGRATDDLAYMIGLHWYAERKQLWEEKMLRAYHQQLLDLNISYTWEDLLADYRLSTITSLFIPVWQWQHGINAAVWWGHLERGFLAFEQLKCMDLLQA